MITLIAAVSKNGVIGNNGDLVFKSKEDMQFFKDNTMNKPVVMGRKTFLSLPSPLKNRTNIVLSKSVSNFEKAIVFKTIEEVLHFHLCSKDVYEEMMIIGGGEIYKQFMPLSDKLLITHIDINISGDTFFPFISEEEWIKVNSVQSISNEKMTFNTYMKRK